jgi:hypothetical protein
VFDGFRALNGGVDANSDPTLLATNQVAFLGNMSLRSDFASTRPPYIKQLLTFPDTITKANYSGMFQGACFYQSLEDPTLNSIIVSIGGHLFRIFIYQNFLVQEITPALPDLVTIQFTVPAGGESLVIDVTDSTSFSISQVLVIDGGTYTITAIGADELTVTYSGGALNTDYSIPTASRVYSTQVASETVNTGGFTVPALGATVTIPITGPSSDFTVNDYIAIAGGEYKVTALGIGSIDCTYEGNAGPQTVAAGEVIYAQLFVTLNEKVTVTVNIPVIGASMSLTVTNGSSFTVAQDLLINDGSYTITGIALNVLTATYNGGASSGSINAGTVILGAQIATETVVDAPNPTLPAFVVPVIGATVTIYPSGPTTDFNPADVILISKGTYTITTVNAVSLDCVYNGGSSVAVGGTVPITTVIYGAQSTVTTPELTTNPFTVPAVSSVVTIPITSDTGFTVAQTFITGGDNFTVTSVLTGLNQVVATYTGGVAHVVLGSQILDTLGNQIVSYATNPPTADFVYMWQAERYVIIVCKNQNTLYFDGSNTRPMSQANDQLQSSYVGCYAWGRNWLAQVNGHRFIASDLVGDPSGTSANIYIDAILYMTENDMLNGGGAFTTPANLGPITAMSVLSQLDTSLGIGPVLVGTVDSIFSVQAPVDRTTWQNLTFPIQSVAVQGAGPTGPRSMTPINSDCWFRALDGLRSLVASRRDFQTNRSNTPNSIEMSPVFDNDTQSLLFYATVESFDNRIFCTCSPYRTKYGVAHRGLAVINQDSISSINKDSAPIWEGLWTGLNIFQIVTGMLNGTKHCYAFVLNDTNGIDLWELQPEVDDSFYDETKSLVSTTNLIPAGTHYFGATFNIESLLSPSTTYSISWGVNDKSLTNVGGNPAYIANPGIGMITKFTTPAVFVGTLLTGNFNSLITSSIYNSSSLTLNRIPIESWLDSRAMSFGDPEQLKKLIMGELYLDDIVDAVVIKIYFRPDQYPLWTAWTTLTICANVSQCTFTSDDAGTCVMWAEERKQYGARITLPRPPETCNNITGKPMNRGFEFQFRMEITGYCRIRKFKLHALEEQQQMEGSCPPSTACKTLTGCLPAYFGYSSYGP